MAAHLDSVFQQTIAWAKRENISCDSFSSTASTNDFAKEQALKEILPLKLYLADSQTAGRGRKGAQWLNAEPGTTLLSSWSIQLSSPPQHIAGPLVGLALYRAVQHLWPNLNWSLKPPNDLYLGPNKIAGILLETVSAGALHRLIIGLGFNILSHPKEVSGATHLTSEDGLGSKIKAIKWDNFLSKWLDELNLIPSFIVQSELTEDTRHQLLKALNSYPHKTDVYLEISPQGDLITESKTLSWSTL